MKPRVLVTLAALGPVVFSSFFACGPHEKPATVAHAVPASDDAGAAVQEDPSPYVLAPWGGTTTDSLPIGKSETGLLVDGVRVVASGGHMRVSNEVAKSALTAAVEVPHRLGGGILFHNDTSIYHADRFDGKLKPLAYFPDGHIHAIDFGFDRVLVRSSDGQRWMIKIGTGERVALEPAGLSEIATRDDGLGLVLTDTARLLATTDAGKTWRDVTAQLKGSPSAIEPREDAIYVSSQEDTSARLEPDGRLGRVDGVPAVPAKDRDSRWRGGESPARTAVRAGVPAEEEGVGLVATMGDLFRISLRRGDILSVQTGKFPVDAQCEGVRTPEDALFLCTRHGANPERFVVSGTLYGKSPQVEQSFAGTLPFYVGDDGSLAYGGPCSGPPRDGVACIRSGQGSWVERSATADGGASVTLGYVVPRSDGTAVSLALQAKPPTITDLVTGDVRTFADSDFPPALKGYVSKAYYGATAVHREWTFMPDGTIRGWHGGRAVTIPVTGPPQASTFVGDNAIYGFSGARGIGVSQEGRIFQTIDRGIAWTEVAAPPSHLASTTVKRPTNAVQCGTLGCIFGPWLRVGYLPDPPKPGMKKVEVPPPAEVASFAKPRIVACESSLPSKGRTIATGDREPDLGAVLLPSGVDANHYPRGSLHPVNGSEGGDGDEQSKRAMSYGTTGSGPGAFRHTFHYVFPFDPSATIRTGVVTAQDIAPAVRGSSISLEDLLGDITFNRAVPTTPNDPASPGGMLFASDRVVALFRGGGPRVALLPEDSSLTPISAAELPGDELVILASNGMQSVVHKLFRGGALTQVFELKGTQDTDRYPSNPDAVAVGPHGEIAVIRLASGNEPASIGDPARLLQAKGKESKLAPWSTLVAVDDPACKADSSGFRATVQVTSEWIHFDGAQEGPENGGPLFARVRWGEQRVCLEGLEMRMRGYDIEQGRKAERWTVMRVLPRGEATRLVLGAGFDYRQPARCSLKAP